MKLHAVAALGVLLAGCLTGPPPSDAGVPGLPAEEGRMGPIDGDANSNESLAPSGGRFLILEDCSGVTPTAQSTTRTSPYEAPPGWEKPYDYAVHYTFHALHCESADVFGLRTARDVSIFFDGHSNYNPDAPDVSGPYSDMRWMLTFLTNIPEVYDIVPFSSQVLGNATVMDWLPDQGLVQVDSELGSVAADVTYEPALGDAAANRRIIYLVSQEPLAYFVIDHEGRSKYGSLEVQAKATGSLPLTKWPLTDSASGAPFISNHEAGANFRMELVVMAK